ncbi:hypothetical protein STEG23_013932, partial [Scotinomys teguina]
DTNSSKPVGSDAPCVVKVEPSDNGPLFTELKFYQRAAKPEQIQKWIRTHKLKYLGVPKYWGSGLHDKNGKSYRFMIMDRFGSDLQKIYEANAKRFSRKTVLQLSLRILDILEYIHEHEYVHGDIKASNLLLSYKNPDQVYLVDYGLAYRYCPDGVHKEYKEDPKRCHDGTLEFTSIDAHNGVAPSRRGDLEILGYCMIQWLSGCLPWEDNLKNPNYVRDSKIRYRDNVAALMEKCFPEKNKPDEIAKYMETVKLLDYTEKPLYQNFRDILSQGLRAIGSKDDGTLGFSAVENGRVKTEPGSKKRKKEVEESMVCSVEDMECSDTQVEEAIQTHDELFLSHVCFSVQPCVLNEWGLCGYLVSISLSLYVEPSGCTLGRWSKKEKICSQDLTTTPPDPTSLLLKTHVFPTSTALPLECPVAPSEKTLTLQRP